MTTRKRSGREKTPVTRAEQWEVVDPTPSKKIALHNGEAIRREMAAVYRGARRGEIDLGDATRLVYMLDRIMKAYETSEIERRLEALEQEHVE
ncbi:MAG: hypothetical protein ACRC1O_10375 [Ralstonia mannitolilytica]|nr:hypothetical protein G5A69_11470 [Ralstonia mannitolilytica]